MIRLLNLKNIIKNMKIVREGRTYRVNLYDILEKGDETKK